MREQLEEQKPPSVARAEVRWLSRGRRADDTAVISIPGTNMTSSRNPNSERIVKMIDEELDGPRRLQIKNRWVRHLNTRIDLPDVMTRPTRKQGGADNRAKVIGLFTGNDELVTAQDEEFFDTSKNIQQKKRESLCESFWTFNRKFRVSQQVTERRHPVPRDVLTPTMAQILRASVVPVAENPAQTEFGEVKQHVEDLFDKFRRKESNMRIRKILKKHP